MEKNLTKVKKEQERDCVKRPDSVPTKKTKRQKRAFSIGNHKLAILRHVQNKPFINIRRSHSIFTIYIETAEDLPDGT